MDFMCFSLGLLLLFYRKDANRVTERQEKKKTIVNVAGNVTQENGLIRQ